MQPIGLKLSRTLALALLLAAGQSCLLTELPQLSQGGNGRITPVPTLDPQYEFLKTNAQFSHIYPQLYSSEENPYTVNVAIRFPAQGTLRFFGRDNRPLNLTDNEELILTMRPGVYPFQVFPPQVRRASLSGVMLVYNVDKTLALATLGKTEATQIFNSDLIEQASSGVLTSYTIHFDGKPVLTYFLGNRMSQFAGGFPTIELDFSDNPGISSLKVNGENLDSFRPALPLMNVRTDQVSGEVSMHATEYPFTMTSAGNGYRGIIRFSNANECTAFVGVKCRFPDDLLESARQGTVAKYTIRAENDAEIAEILISAR